MKHIRTILNLVIIFSIVVPVGALGQAAANPTPQVEIQPSSMPDPDYAPDRVIVKFRSALQIMDQGTGQSSLDALMAAYGVSETRQLYNGVSVSSELSQIHVLHLFPGSDLESFIKALSVDPNVEWAEPDYLAYPAATTPNDPKFPDQWGLTQIEAPEAWDTTTGAVTVSIAIIDSGVDDTHPDLTGQIWINPGEIAGNGIDDDNNGHVDDVNGWDFVNDDNDPSDDHGHGTQVAGIAAAATDNSLGIAGVCWDCKIMPVKVMQASGVANYSDIAAGVLYAAQKGAKVINISLGGYSNSSALQTAVQTALDTYGSVVVAGAGNDNLSTPFYPAAYEGVLSVAGTDQSDVKAGLSNYGDWIDIAAPALAITTTFQGGDYGAVDGTSYAAPFVAGIAGLLRSQHTDWSANTVRAQITHTADDIDSLNPGFEGKLGSGRVDADTAVSTDTQPLLTYDSHTIDGVDNGRPEPGSTVDLDVTIFNDWVDAANVQATLTSIDPYVTIVDDSASFGDIATYESRANTTPFQFNVSSSAPYNHDMDFSLQITADGGYSANVYLTITTRSGIQNVSGVISSDITWTNDKEYHVVGNILVQDGVTLTIEAGTTVFVTGNYIIQSKGDISAFGTEANPISFVSNQLNPTFSDWSGIQVDGGMAEFIYCKISHAENGVSAMAYGMIIISHCDINNNNNGIIGNDVDLGILHITDSNIKYNQNSGIGYPGSGSIIHNNVIAYNGEYGIGALTVLSLGTISGNLIHNNGFNSDSGYGIVGGSGTIISNTIMLNNIGVGFEDPSTIIFSNNNILNNAQYDVHNGWSNKDLNAQNNWWGTTDTTVIDDNIFDWLDDFNLGIVDYSNYLTNPEPTAPAYVVDVNISPDTTLGIQTATFDVEFSREMDPSFIPILVFDSSLYNRSEVFSTENSGLASNNVTSINIDQEKNVWFGTDQGISKLDSNGNWTTYNTSNSDLLNNWILDIEFDLAGNSWFGVDNNGVAKLTPDGTWTNFNWDNSDLACQQVNKIAVDQNNNKWFGCPNQGVSMLDTQGNWITYTTSNSGLLGMQGNEIFVDTTNRVWFGEKGVGQFVGVSALLPNGNWINYNTTNSGIVSNFIGAISEDKNGNMWFGSSDDGISVLTLSGEWLSYTTSNSDLVGDSILEIIVDNTGNIWIATDSGLNIVSPDGTWEEFTSSNGNFDGHFVRALAVKLDGNAWLSTHISGFSDSHRINLFHRNGGYEISDNSTWLNSSTWQASKSITTLILRDTYVLNISKAVGSDSIEIVPTVGYTFTVDYAGAIGDTTPPPPPAVTVCAGDTLNTLSAEWSASDPDSSIGLTQETCE